MKTIYAVAFLSLLLTNISRGQSYQLTDLGALVGTNSYAQGINNQGQIVGYWQTTNGDHAFLYETGQVSDLGLLGVSGTNVYALSINNSGQVVGFSQTATGAVAFVYQSGGVTNLGNFGGLGSYAFGINDSGQIVGHVATAGGALAFLYNNGAETNLGTLGGTNSFAYGLNNALQVAGSSLETDNVTEHAFLWQNGIMSDLNGLLTNGSGWQLVEACAINDSGSIAGWGLTNGQQYAFLYYSNGWAQALGTLAGGTNSYALGLNGSNVVVGASSSTSGNHAATWSGGNVTDLNNLANVPGWQLEEATAINDAGEIVGWGVTNGMVHAFLIQPYRPPGITITNPANNALVVAGTSLNLGASVTSGSRAVTQVQFFQGLTNLGVVTSSPYTLSISAMNVGTNVLTAVVTDNTGITVTSSPVKLILVAPLAGMVAWWRAEGNALDSLGTNNGTLNGGAGYTNGEVGSAFSFDGSSGYVGVGTPSDLNMSTTFSFEGWIYPTGAGSGGAYGGILICKEYQYEVTRASNGSIEWAFANSSPGFAWVNSGAVTPLNQWSHVAVTYSNGVVKTYLNGALTNTYNGSGAIGSAGSPNDFRIGGRSLTSQFFQGRIDEASVYNRVLTDAEIAAIYNAGSTGKDSSSVYFNVTVTNPPNNAGFPLGAGINLGANTWDAVGRVQQVQFFQGTNSLGVVTNSPYVLTWTNAAGGNYMLTAQAMDNNGLMATSAPVNVVVEVPPSITITNPANNTVVAAGTSLNLGASATSGSSAVTQVQFFQGLMNLGVVTSSPYTLTSSAMSVGTNALTAVVTDSSGIMVTSAPVNLIVTSPLAGMVAWWRAEGNALDSVGTNNGTLYGGAGYTNGEVGSAFSFDGSSGYVGVGTPSDLNMSTTFSFEGWIYPTGSGSGGAYGGILVCKEYQYEVTRASNGSIEWAFANSSPGFTWVNSGAVTPLNQWSHVAVTYSNGVVKTYLNGALTNTYNGSGAIGSAGSPNDFRIGGRTLTSQFFQGRIDEASVYNRVLTDAEIAAIYNAGSAGKSSPSIIFSVTLTNPVNNATFPFGAGINLGANTWDAAGRVQQVQFFQGTNSVGVVTNSPYVFTWTNAAGGNYMLTARAIDNNGLMATSAPVNIVVVDPPPVVSIASPVNNAYLGIAPINVTLSASASDVSGVRQVQFFQGTTSLGVVGSPPYNLTWTAGPASNYSLTAVATGNDGLTATSSVVNVVVDKDTDGDGLGDIQESLYGTNPNVSDGFWIWVGAPSTAVIP